jgi:hypothetical protein
MSCRTLELTARGCAARAAINGARVLGARPICDTEK